MIGEAVDTLFTLGWALLAWVLVLAAAGTVVLLAAAVTGALAVRGAWRGLAGAWRAHSGSLAAVRALHALQSAPERYRPPLRPLWVVA